MGSKTTIKLPVKPFTGQEGNTFSKDNQPPPEAKKAGWEEWRARRMLTQSIIAKMTEGENLDEYIQSLLDNAKLGNAKAIETINKGIEDQVDKSEVVHKVEKDIDGFIIEDK